ESLKLIQDTQKNIDAVIERLTKDGKIFALDNDYVSKNHCGELINSLIENVKVYQSQYKSEAGMPIESLNVSRSLLNLAVSSSLLVMDSGKVRTPDFVPENDEVFNANKRHVKDICQSHKWQLITLDELKKEAGFSQEVFNKVIQAMRNSGELTLIPEGFVLISELEGEMRGILKSLGEKVTLAQVRDATGSTRKFILPILEYFDSKGYTRRAGDYRVVL
ncbi:MAG: SelB C-terminal domain-containing protein, partial [Synergistaceae bacterium]|nr:SelB C-terminal domain-containing protein [Synergistaceae bacterium]